MYFTQHSIDRFQEHWAPAMSRQACLRELVVLSRTARPLRARTPKGDEQWIATDGAPVVLVVKREPSPHSDGLVCVTVLAQACVSDPAEEPIGA